MMMVTKRWWKCWSFVVPSRRVQGEFLGESVTSRCEKLVRLPMTSEGEKKLVFKHQVPSRPITCARLLIVKPISTL